MAQLHPPPADAQLTALVGLLYRAAAEPGWWPAVLERLEAVFGTSFVNVGLVTRPEEVWWFDDPACLIEQERDVNVVFQRGLGTEELRELASRWVAADGFSRPAFQEAVRRGRPWIADRREFASDRDFERLPYCQEFALPHDCFHTLGGAMLAQGRELGLFLNIHRPRRSGPFDEREAALLRSLLPHLQQALEVHQQWRALRQQARNRALALDAVAQPCLTLDARGRVLWANRAAEALLERGDGLCLRAGLLISPELEQQHALHAALRRCLGGPGEPPAGGVRLHLTRRAGPPLRLSLLRVPPADGEQPTAQEVLCVLDDPGGQQLPPAGLLEARYGLTPAECRVALAVAQGQGAEDIAAQGQVSVGTVRNQLKQVLSKTGTHRQAALVRLLLSLPDLG